MSDHQQQSYRSKHPTKLSKYCFFQVTFKSTKDGGFFSIDPGRFFHRKGPIYERPFCLILVFQKGTYSLAKLLLHSILN